MKLTNREIIGLLNTLTSFGDKKLPQRISFAITKNISILTKEYSVYEQAMKKLMKRYDSDIVKDDEGIPVCDSDGIPKLKANEKEFRDEINDLLGISVDVEIYHIDENVFDYDDVNARFDPMSPTQILVLQSILCEYE